MIDRKLFKSFIYEDVEEEEAGYDEEGNLHEPTRYTENMYASSFRWIVAEQYGTVNNRIRVEKLGDYRVYCPVEYNRFADLFNSFTKIGRSERHFDKRILDWVESHGLLQRRYYERDRIKENPDLEFSGPYRLFVKDKELSKGKQEKMLNQASISVDDFRTKVQEAQSAAQLYLYLYDRDFSALNSWIEQLEKQDRLPDQIEKLLKRGDTRYSKTSESMSATEIMMITTGFEAFLTRQIAGVKVSLSSSHNSSRSPEYNYAPRRTYRCPDLLTAIWLQFYLAVTERHPLKRCANPSCFTLFFPNDGRQKYCDSGCRSTGRPNRRKK